jgi:hypothetical protein
VEKWSYNIVGKFEVKQIQGKTKTGYENRKRKQDENRTKTANENRKQKRETKIGNENRK